MSFIEYLLTIEGAISVVLFAAFMVLIAWLAFGAGSYDDKPPERY